jgi:predicted amidophosphoribosyltransferase
MVKTNPMKIPGNWREGYVLDFHTIRSDFLGHDEFGHPMFDTQRSEIGELLYRLKYKSDRTVLNAIVDTVVDFIHSWVPAVDAILPVPPSRQDRVYQPVPEIANGVGNRLKILVNNDCIVKVKDTPELKNVYGYSERLLLLEDAYAIDASSLIDRDVLLFDDLYRSGATLNAMARALYASTSGKPANVYALALTRTRTAS